MRLSRPHSLLILILLVYLVLGILYAVYTPAWQAPDEPAHYNYVRYLVQNGAFPVLQMGDYPHTYMEEIKSQHFPPSMSIDPIRYEYHQPPLYYVLAAPVFALSGGALLPLRLFSVLLGAGLVLLVYLIARRVAPARPFIAVAAAAFAAYLPQHLASASQAGNDILAELLLAMVLYVLVDWSVLPASRFAAGRAFSFRHGPGARLTLGLLLGLVLITKTTAYIAVPLAGGVLLWLWLRERAPARCILGDVALVALPAAVLALPWYARDIAVYGWPDFLGLNRHDAIVVGQMRTAEFLTQSGWNGYLDRMLTFTFKSFWGVFGWLGVFMDARVYVLLTLFSGAMLGGLLLRLYAGRAHPSGAAVSSAAVLGAPASGLGLRLLAISALLTLLVYAWYNMQFVQTQGRYLFTALVPVAIAVAMGWQAALEPRWSRWLAGALFLLALAFAAWSFLAGHGLPKWPLAISAVFTGALAMRPWLPRRFDGALFALPFLGLPLLALYALFGAIVPQLAFLPPV